AGVLAYLVLISFQLFQRPNLSFKGWKLKRGGSLQPAAFALLAGMALLLVFWSHSALVRFYTYQGDAGYRSARAWQPVLFDVVAPRPTLATAEQARLERGAAALDAVRRLGWFESHGLEAKLAWLAALRGEDAALERHAQAALERAELAFDMHQLLGRRAFEAGELAAAAEHFERAVATDGESLWARINLGVAQAQGGQLERAKTTFEAATQELGENVTLAYNLGLVEAYAGRIDAATVRFSRAVELDPRNLPARENFAGMLAALGRFEESAEQYAVALEMSPDDAQTRVLLARVLAAMGRRSEALEQVGEALRLAPGLPAAQRLAAELRGGA
ncbi:MAG: tetratricopeptide repeat protein, partial [Acidobacteriota bacterium]